MLGTRGVRLGVVKPGLYAMQVRALMEAARQRVADGGHPIVEIMIPLTVSREELALARGWVEEAVAEVAAEAAPSPSKGAPRPQAKAGTLEVTIGTMIETPRAALLAGEIAEEADFFSFGTNDLTQMTFGFSRDDVEGRMMGAYLELGLLEAQPLRRGRRRRRRRAGPSRYRAGTGHPPVAQGRGLRRARWRPRVHHPVLRRRARLRELFAVPGARGPFGRRAGRAGRGAGEAKRPADLPGRCEPARAGAAPRYRHCMGIPDEDVAQVRAATDIVALIGEHAALKRVGRRWTGLCPFHTEKSPSFSVNAEEGFYYCFGCQASGDAITFVRATEHLDFVDAVRLLADRAGVALHEDARSGRTASAGPNCSTPWSGRWSGTTSGSCGRPTPGWPGTTCARGAMTVTSCASSAWGGRPTSGMH